MILLDFLSHSGVGMLVRQQLGRCIPFSADTVWTFRDCLFDSCSHRGLRSPSGRQRPMVMPWTWKAALWTFRGCWPKHGDLPGLLDGESGRHRHPLTAPLCGSTHRTQGNDLWLEFRLQRGWGGGTSTKLPSPTAVLSKVFWVRGFVKDWGGYLGSISTRLIF